MSYQKHALREKIYGQSVFFFNFFSITRSEKIKMFRDLFMRKSLDISLVHFFARTARNKLAKLRSLEGRQKGSDSS
jgi:hypothetical protein